MIISSTQQQLIEVTPLDRRSNPTTIDGAPEWSTDRPDIIALEPVSGTMQCIVRATGVLGVAQVTVSGDADRSTGVRTIVSPPFTFDVQASEAFGFGIAAVGAPTEQEIV